MSLIGATATFQEWTPAEDAAIRAAYPSAGIKAAAAALPERTESAIYHRARRLGLDRRRWWTAADDKQLWWLWSGATKLGAIAKTLGRTPRAVYYHAQISGLPLGAPDGFEYLTAAAKRTGFDTSQLRSIMRWAGKHVSLSRTRPGRRRARHHFVDPIDVEDAVEAWSKTEPINAAARRAGVTWEILHSRLLTLGLKPPTARKHWRVTELDVQRALALPSPGFGPRKYRRAA